MNSQQKLTFTVLVKAAPVLTAHLDESMCVAGVSIDATGTAHWVRLHPVPFRDLAETERFSKFQQITVSVIRPSNDRRPETFTPIEGSIELDTTIGTDHGWAARRNLVAKLPERSMCELVEGGRRGSGPGIESLGVVRPAETPELQITLRDKQQLAEWRRRAEGARNRRSLFETDVAKPPLEVIPWRFRYRYRCSANNCAGHEQTIIDWEILQFFRRVRDYDDWQHRMTAQFCERLWNGRDAVLFVGNQVERPNAFLVLGIFWPPDVALQTSFDL